MILRMEKGKQKREESWGATVYFYMSPLGKPSGAMHSPASFQRESVGNCAMKPCASSPLNAIWNHRRPNKKQPMRGERGSCDDLYLLDEGRETGQREQDLGTHGAWLGPSWTKNRSQSHQDIPRTLR